MMNKSEDRKNKKQEWNKKVQKQDYF